MDDEQLDRYEDLASDWAIGSGDIRHGLERCIDEIRKLKKELGDEQFLHAACLSIAEGAPGWDKPITYLQEREAQRAVRKLRWDFERMQRMLGQLGRSIMAEGPK